MMHHAMPALSISLLMYGLFPRICQKIGLVDKSDHYDLDDPNIRTKIDYVNLGQNNTVLTASK